MTDFELRPLGSPALGTSEQLTWDAISAGSVTADIDGWLTELGLVPAPLRDLVRIGVAAYCADQLVKRRRSYTRTIDLLVHVTDIGAWQPTLVEWVCDLLHILAGDSWAIELVEDKSRAPVSVQQAEVERPRRVALLSGGLDSFAGALLTAGANDTAYIGHWDNTITKAAQGRVARWISAQGLPLDFLQVRIGVKSREHSRRSRSFLFMALAAAYAAARGASLVEVPENGFTSLNPPLGPERGGVLTTRSTHPYTLHLFNGILAGLGTQVRVENPHAWETKGELVRRAAAAAPAAIEDGVALTLSCAKLNQNWHHASPHAACGLCVACQVRRGAINAAGLIDLTAYSVSTVSAADAAAIRKERADDLSAIDLTLLDGIDDVTIMSMGPYPPGYDEGRALDLCRRGLRELANAPR